MTKREVTLDRLHLTFDISLQDTGCERKWPKIYEAMIAHKFEVAKSNIRRWQETGSLSDEGAEKCITIIEEIQASGPGTIC